MNIEEMIKEGTYSRDYRKYTTEYSLNPAIAFAINILSNPSDKDRVLDPCCGSGSILIERQRIKPCFAYGIDIDPKALDGARENIRAASLCYVDRQNEYKTGCIILKHANILEQKFPEGYFTKIISNLPYGIHTGSKEKNKELYTFLPQACEKWLIKNGQAIFLTQAKKLLKESFKQNPTFELIQEIPLQVRGLTPSIFIYQKK